MGLFTLSLDRRSLADRWLVTREASLRAKLRFLATSFHAYRQVRRKVPHLRSFTCQNCGHCCTSRALHASEFLTMVHWAEDHLSAERRRQVIQNLGRMRDPSTPICPFLDRENQACMIYMARPLHCKIFGLGEERCPNNLHKPQVVSKKLEAELYDELYAQSVRVPGAPSKVAAAPFEWWFAHYLGDADLLAQVMAHPGWQQSVRTEPLPFAPRLNSRLG